MATKFQEGVDKLLECPICFEQFKKPKMLKCQHSFCLEPCLKNMAKSNTFGKMKYFVECPICRQGWSVSNLNNIPDNLSLKNLIELRKQQLQSNDHSNETDSGKNGKYTHQNSYLNKSF